MKSYYTKEQWALAMRGLPVHQVTQIMDNNFEGVSFTGCTNKGELCEGLASANSWKSHLHSQAAADRLKRELEDEERPDHAANKAKREQQKLEKKAAVVLSSLEWAVDAAERNKILEGMDDQETMLPVLTKAAEDKKVNADQQLVHARRNQSEAICILVSIIRFAKGQ